MKHKALFSLLVILLTVVLAAVPAFAQDGGESPVLAEQVAAGTLPPLAERLPANPRVVEPLKEAGQYGGNLRVGFVGTSPGWGGLLYIAGWDQLMQWKADFSAAEPNIAESVDVSDDATEYTFRLREGMKWSDGEPFTADDIEFYVNDIMMNAELSPAGIGADWLPQLDDDRFKFEKIDATTFKFIFPHPNGSFLNSLATWSGREIAFYPKHYLMQFHKSYNPDGIDALVAAEDGVSDWVGLFNKKANRDDPTNFLNFPERPTLFPWVVTQALGTGTQLSLARNPYYWKVDSAGNQLPYIDEVTGISYQDGQARTLAMISGELDYIVDPGPENRITYFDALDSGAPIQIIENLWDGANTAAIQFNQTYTADPVLADIFANKDFRIGMSHAINRQEVIDIVFSGQGVPAQVGPLATSPLYNEQLTTQFVEFSVNEANAALDKVIPDKDANGMRLRPDGTPLQIIFTISNNLSFGTNWVQIAELLIGYWNAVGVDVQLNSVASAQFDEYRLQNNIQATIFVAEGGAGLIPMFDPRSYTPMEWHSYFGLGWYFWRVATPGAADPVEPPQDVIDARALYDAVGQQPTQELQLTQMQKVIQSAADNFWMIGISTPAANYQPINARLGNQPDSFTQGWIEGVTKLTYPEQWYIHE
jgi:peptide/nickel transport system substrate-binding protein